MSHFLAEELEHLTPEEIVDRVLQNGAARPCVTCSFQAEDMIIVDVLRRRLPSIPIIFLETGYHFAETYSYRDRMAKLWNLNVINASAKQTVAEQESAFGILNQSDPTRCCQLRQVEPLFDALHPFDVWFTGLRREQSPTRRNLKVIEQHKLPSGTTLQKVSPLADWTWEKVWQYTVDNRIEYLPLYDLGIEALDVSRALPFLQKVLTRGPAVGAEQSWNAAYIPPRSARTDDSIDWIPHSCDCWTHRNRGRLIHHTGTHIADWFAGRRRRGNRHVLRGDTSNARGSCLPLPSTGSWPLFLGSHCRRAPGSADWNLDPASTPGYDIFAPSFCSRWACYWRFLQL